MRIWSINLQQRCKGTRCRRDSLSNKWRWENRVTTCKRMKLDTYLTSYMKINSKWIQYLNVRCETVSRLKENIGRNLLDLGVGNDCLDLTQNSWQQNLKYTSGTTLNQKASTTQQSRKVTYIWEKIFASPLSD